MNLGEQHIVLKTFDLVIGYQSKKEATTIASNLNFDVPKGSFICLIGKNGIGKSTLLRTLTNVQPALSGTIQLNGKSIDNHTNLDLAKQVSLVLTEKLPESNLTVFEIVALGRQPYTNWIGKLSDNDFDKVTEVLDRLDISHLANKQYYELSDGQLQKVLIARALAQDTNIIILDEPTAHLDVQHTMETFVLLKDLAESLNKTIITSTHEIHLALQTAHTIWMMTEKEFILDTPKQLIKDKKIEQLFDSDKIEFNEKLNQFEFRK